MATNSPKPELVAIVGPTASGKSELAMRIARQFNGEIVAADSRTVYRGLDIGTAKPTKTDQEKITHWGIDLVDPGQSFTAADFKNYATKKIKEIDDRGKLPIVVGGTGLYIDSLLFDYEFGPPAVPGQRKNLEAMTKEQLQATISSKGLKMPINSANKRHLIRAIELAGYVPKKQHKPIPGLVLVGLLPPDDVLRSRIMNRARAMFNNGVKEETVWLKRKYPNVPLENVGIVYKLYSQVLEKQVSAPEALEQFQTREWQYARRQRTWFKRNPYIQWFSGIDSADEYLKTVLNK